MPVPICLDDIVGALSSEWSILSDNHMESLSCAAFLCASASCFLNVQTYFLPPSPSHLWLEGLCYVRSLWNTTQREPNTTLLTRIKFLLMSMEVLLSEVASFDRGFAAQHKPQSLRMLNATPCDLGQPAQRCLTGESDSSLLLGQGRRTADWDLKKTSVPSGRDGKGCHVSFGTAVLPNYICSSNVSYREPCWTPPLTLETQNPPARSAPFHRPTSAV